MSPVNLNTGASQLMKELFEIQVAFHKFGVSKEHRNTIESIATKAYNNEIERMRGNEIDEPIFKEES